MFLTSCMEKQRPKSDTVHKDLFPSINCIISGYIKAEQPDWEQLEAISKTPYERKQSTITNEFELPTVYKQINKTAKQEEKKPFLCMLTSAQPNKHLMEQLYTSAYEFVDYELNIKQPDLNINTTNFLMLLQNMKNAHDNCGITADCMGTYAYKSYDRDTTNKYIPLLFCCLKRYLLTVQETKEDLDLELFSTKNENLPHIFGVENFKTINSEQLPDAAQLKGIFFKKYPAQNHLCSKLKILMSSDTFNHTRNTLTRCLYTSEQQILFSNYSNGDYTDLKKEFYDKVYSLLIKNGSSQDIYNILMMIEKAKEQGDIQKESDLGRAMLNFDPTETTMETVMRWFNTSYSAIDTKKYNAIDTKNRIALFCNLVEKYNNAQPHKLRPTPLQYFCYNRQKELDLALPDSFNSKIFDENSYAFDEFKKFREYVIELMDTSNQEIQLYVNCVYYSKKSDAIKG